MVATIDRRLEKLRAPMEYESAKLELLRNAGIAEDYHDGGFVSCLRPLTSLKADNFNSVVESILSVGFFFSSANTVERSIVHAIWSLAATTRLWGIDDDGMLVRNNLISPAYKILGLTSDRRHLL